MLLLLACVGQGSAPPFDAPPQFSPPEPALPTPDDDTAAPAESRVVIVVLDGARLDETLGDGASDLAGTATADLLPELRARLLPHATRVTGARNLGIPITTESHTELFTGLRQDLATFPPGIGGRYRSDVPTIFEAVRARRGLAADQVPMLVNTVLVEDLAWSAWPGLGEAFGATHHFRTDDEGRDLDDPVVLGDLRDWLATHDTHLAFTNLHAIDLDAHTGDADAYLDRVRAVDAPLAELWAWLEATPPYAGTTTLVVVADHGRHRDESFEDWSGHGDQCDGCRDVPLLFAGPGIRDGAVVEADASLADVAATVAWILEAPLPMGRGRVLTEIFDAAPPVAPPGFGRLAASGARLAWEDDGVWLDGALRSTPGARLAEGPVLASGTLCWRELSAEGAWSPRCERDGVALAVPEPLVSPRWEPALVQEAGATWAAWVDNPYGWTAAGDADLVVGRWDPDGTWVAGPTGPDAVLPTHVSLARVDGLSVVAFAASSSTAEGRDTRRIEVWTVGASEWSRRAVYAPDGTYARFEAPALRSDGVAVAAIAYDAGTTVVVGERESLARLDPSGRVLAHLGVQWVGDAVVWARLTLRGTVEVCRWHGGGLDIVDTGATAISGLAATKEGFHATLDGRPERFEWP